MQKLISWSLSVDAINNFLATYRVGDYAGILGLIVSVIGFIWTVRAAVSSRDAALQTKAVVQDIRNDMRRTETVSDFSAAVAIMEEIKRLHRLQSLELLPDRYSQITKFLIGVRSANPLLTEDEHKVIQSAITQFSALERLIDGCLAKTTQLDTAKVNGLVSKQLEAVHGLLVSMKSKIGGVGNE
ncbi:MULTISPECIES: hypothetical protein [Pseudomonas]|uniref:hypothetical protein n=1 Tax=Pseudomonas TaxID=286 RepID=UPI0011CE16F5|nr:MULTISPECIES: hypothetical protein [Pseudomonas]MCO7506310.1 hypothetical protein [Pseudomonas sp. VE 267-6A]MCO7531699.1 hypothetical protein [Pseudomonas sp. 2]